jgi:putative membrane protein (TIGR04086 family)
MRTVKTAKPAKALPWAILSGLLAAYAITCAIFIGCAVLLTYAGMSERAVPVIVSGTAVIAVIVAGFDASRSSKSKGWLWGMLTGGLYAAVLFALLFIVAKSFTVDLRKVTLLAMSLAGGALGGIAGINTRR